MARTKMESLNEQIRKMERVLMFMRLCRLDIVLNFMLICYPDFCRRLA